MQALPRQAVPSSKVNRPVGLFAGDRDVPDPVRKQIGRDDFPAQVLGVEILVLLQDYDAERNPHRHPASAVEARRLGFGSE